MLVQEYFTEILNTCDGDHCNKIDTGAEFVIKGNGSFGYQEIFMYTLSACVAIGLFVVVYMNRD